MRFARWDMEASSADTTLLLSSLALRHINEIRDDPLRTRLLHLIGVGDIRTLCALELHYPGLSPEDSGHARQVLAFFTKRVDVELDLDPREEAWRKFKEAEAKCSETNDLFRSIASGKACLLSDSVIAPVLYGAQRKIARILGPVPSFEDLRPRFGPGATTSTKKRDACPAAKLGAVLACSEDLAPIAKCVLEQMQALLPEGEGDTARVTVEIHPGRLGFVPKSAKEERAIVTEPMLNGMFQLAVGDHMAARLRRFGCDIRDQTLNQRLALEGSLTGDLATLDLSSASDMISLELVYHLLPLDWAHFLSRLRTSQVVCPDGVRRLHKFSSMGNGFTFPLETLIFLCLARAASEDHPLYDRVNAYGDDIIVPSDRFDLLSLCLTACGFKVNSAKSFKDGPFRESCGRDYHSGIPIRPFYVKGQLTGERVFAMHNYYARRGLCEFSDHILTWILPALRLFGPDGYGDGHLIGGHHWRTKHSHVQRGFGGYIFDTFTWRPPRAFRVFPNDRVLPAYSIYVAGPPGPAFRSRRVSDLFGIQRRKMLTDQLYEPLVTTSVVTVAESPDSAVHDDTGCRGHVLPGRDGYKRISIYTLGT